MKRLIDAKLQDATAERVRRSHAEAITELQATSAIINAVELPNATDVYIAHGLGRIPRIVIVSMPYPNISTIGAIHEIRASTIDRSRVIVLKADGYGLTVFVDVEVK